MNRFLLPLCTGILLLLLAGCTSKLDEAKSNAQASLNIYEESQKLQGDQSVRSGLIWLLGGLNESNIPKPDKELVSIRDEITQILTDKYFLTKDQIDKLSSINDDNKLTQEVEGIYEGIYKKIVNEQNNQKAQERVSHEQEVRNSDPQIGWSKQDVLKSKWGEPDDINKTTTEYGTSEQWVYDNKGYIYFDDGVVTAIQD